MPATSDKLKPCPFCGGSETKGIYKPDIDYNDEVKGHEAEQWAFIRCYSCWATGPARLICADQIEIVFELWNTRIQEVTTDEH